MSSSSIDHRSHCKKCKNVIINTFKYCQHCGTENIGLIQASLIESRTCTSFSSLDYNVITVIISFIHSKYEPLKYYEPSYEDYTADQYNAENDAICILMSLSHHYSSYKAKNFFFRLNKKYSLDYYNNVVFSLKMSIDDPSRQLQLDLESSGIKDVLILQNASRLILSYNSSITDVSRLGNVHTLYLNECEGITDVSALGNVHELHLGGCTGITDVSRLGNVHELHLNCCTGITDVSRLGNVHKLHLDGCTGITDVSALGNVHELYLQYCNSLTVIRDLSSVSILDISFCGNIEEVTNLPSATILTTMDCSNLRVIRDLPKLKYLSAFGCKSLTEISGISVIEIDVRGCTALKEIKEIKGTAISIKIRN